MLDRRFEDISSYELLTSESENLCLSSEASNCTCYPGFLKLVSGWKTSVLVPHTFSILGSGIGSLKLETGVNPPPHTNICLRSKDNDGFLIELTTLLSECSSVSLHGIATVLFLSGFSKTPLSVTLSTLKSVGQLIEWYKPEVFKDSELGSCGCFSVSSGLPWVSSWLFRGWFFISAALFKSPSLVPNVPIVSRQCGQSLNSSLHCSYHFPSTRSKKSKLKIKTSSATK